jgi:hypothetical protein
MTHWTTFEQNMKTIMDTVRNYILQEQQKELENAQMNR